MAHETSSWTLAELHRLPDDGNKYELVRGDLFVTPPPSWSHESLASVLHSRLHPYVEAQRLGRIYRPGVLTEREVEVLCLVARGLSNRAIGKSLVIAPKTVGRHVEHICGKLGIRSRAAAALYASANGLVE